MPTWRQGTSEVNTINQIRIIPHSCMNTLWTMVSAKIKAQTNLFMLMQIIKDIDNQMSQREPEANLFTCGRQLTLHGFTSNTQGGETALFFTMP